jgi:hypothetical protein
MVAEIGKPARKVLDAVSSVQYVDPGYLVFSREGTLVAQRFDAAPAQVSGEPFAIVEPVRYFFSTGAATFATSRTGELVYQSHRERGRVVWLDRTGNEVGTVSASTSHSRARISPDGTRVVFDRARPQLGSFDLWMFEIERGIEQQLTSDRLSETHGRRRNVAAMEPRRARAVVPRRGSPTRLHPGSNGSDVDRRRSTPSVRREERPQVG